MDHVHGHHNSKRRRLDATIQPCVQRTVQHSPMSISSLVDHRTHHRPDFQFTKHSTLYSSPCQALQQTHNSTTSSSLAPFHPLVQSSSQSAQPFEARRATPARHFRPWEVSDSSNFSPAQDSTTSFALLNSPSAPIPSFQAQDLGSISASYSRRTNLSPHRDPSSEDDLMSFEYDRPEDEAQDPNISTASQANTEQSVIVCFGMVSWPV